MLRLVITILVVTLAESAWALFCAETNADLGLFYVGLVAASVVFFVPGLAETSRRAQ